MSTTRQVTRRASWTRVALRWMPTFLGFPLGGLIAELVSGPVDGLGAAIVGGCLTGAVLGAVQSWGMGTRGPATAPWVAGTALALGIGLGAGSAAVGYGTSVPDLVVQGAVCGLAIGVAQAALLRPLIGRIAFAWVPVLSALWALGWAITASIGVDVEAQYTVFGSSGALVVTAATAVLPIVLLERRAS